MSKVKVEMERIKKFLSTMNPQDLAQLKGDRNVTDLQRMSMLSGEARELEVALLRQYFDRRTRYDSFGNEPRLTTTIIRAQARAQRRRNAYVSACIAQQDRG